MLVAQGSSLSSWHVYYFHIANCFAWGIYWLFIWKSWNSTVGSFLQISAAKSALRQLWQKGWSLLALWLKEIAGFYRFLSSNNISVKTFLRLHFYFGRAGPSLSAFNYDSNYGKKALTMMYRGIMEQVYTITINFLNYFLFRAYSILRVGFKVTRILFQLFLRGVVMMKLASKHSSMKQKML